MAPKKGQKADQGPEESGGQEVTQSLQRKFAGAQVRDYLHRHFLEGARITKARAALNTFYSTQLSEPQPSQGASQQQQQQEVVTNAIMQGVAHQSEDLRSVRDDVWYAPEHCDRGD